MRKLLALLTLAVSAWGAQNIALPGSKYVRSTAPALTTTSSVRIVQRIQNWSGNYSSGTPILDYYGIVLSFVGANTIQCAGFTNDSGGTYGRNMAIGVSGKTDLIVSCQRDGPNGKILLEAWSADGTGYASNTNSGMTFGTASVATQSIQIGNDTGTSMAMDLAYVKIFSTVVPASSTPPSPLLVGDVANYEFEGNGNDTSGNSRNLGTTYTNTGTIAYSTTTGSYPPICDAGTSTTRQSAAMWQLNSSGVFVPSGATPTYMWQQTAGPSRVRWPDGHKAASPRVAGSEKGEYAFSLEVSADGMSSSCSVTVGTVATDASGNVIGTSSIEGLIGVPVRAGSASRWPLIDDWQKKYLDKLKAMLDAGGLSSTTYNESWMTAEAGTVTMSGTAITGTGTNFLSTICNGDGSVKSGKSILLWFSTGTLYTGYSTPYPDPKGKRNAAVSSCADDTHLTLVSAPGTQTYIKFTGSMQYSVWSSTDDGNYQNVQHSWAYYDPAFAAYDYCYRSGLTSYCTLARRVADIQWNLPDTNKGTVYLGEGGAPTWQAERNWGYVGLVMRAMDGAPEMWPGLDRMAHYTETREVGAGSIYDLAKTGQNPLDLREDSYRIAILASNYMKTPGATQKASSLAKLLATYTKLDGVKQVSGNMIWWVQPAPDGYTYTGSGAQPYMEGMFGTALSWMARAFDQAYSETSDTQYSTAAANIRTSWIPGIGHWMQTYGYNTHWGGGLYYARGFGQCEPSPDGIGGSTTNQCDADGPQEARALAMPAVGFLRLAVQYDPTLESFANNLLAGIFGKPGSGSLIEDALYNSAQSPPSGGNYNATSTFFTKWVGEGFGMFSHPAGYEALLNGFSSADMRTYSVALNFPTNTSTRTLTLKLPDGTTTNPTCSGSPCSITLDYRQGGAKLTVDALNSAGQTIGSATLDLVVP